MRDRIFQKKLFTDNCEGLPKERLQSKKRMMQFNSLSPLKLKKRKQLIGKILGQDTDIWIEAPFYFCYGKNIEIGCGCYIGFNCNFVDDGKIILGDNVMIGPAVTIVTVGHPIHPNYREYMYAIPVTLERNCWVGAGSIILPGIKIGANSVVGSGSVVTKDIPPNTVAAGNPCKVLREINEHDKNYYYRNLKIEESDLIEEQRLR